MSRFKFIDLFAGIGGFHIAMESLGGECVFSSEIDPFSRKTYEYNFKKISPNLFINNMFNDDIRKINPIELPYFDLLCAGFPCQPFSQAGLKKGFDDNDKSERGNLFFNIVEILEVKRPKAYFLENVQGLLKHDNGNTFKTIRDILENELNYSFHYKIVKASDYGLPQLRPRVFIIGFKDEDFLSNFSFPPKIPLKFNMSDIWKGKCNKEIGFTLRVGGRGSNINDRRNWDSYLVDNEIKRINVEQAKKMQGFPDNFQFPVNNTQAMKQLGNSVAIDAVRACGEYLINHLEYLKNKKELNTMKNKGEWTELYVFIKLLNDKKILLSDQDLNIKDSKEYFNIKKITNLNIDDNFYLLENDFVLIENKKTKEKREVKVSDFLNKEIIDNLIQKIKLSSKTFNIDEFNIIQDILGISLIKGGNSNQKSDIILDIENNFIYKQNEGFGIKSYLGSMPTLLNASGNTNFIFEIQNLDSKFIDEINNINTNTKLKDRINIIQKLGGQFKFYKIEKDSMQYNLSMVDSLIPDIVAEMLYEFYLNRTNKLSINLENIYKKNKFSTDLKSIQVKVKRLLVSILLGFFAGKKLDGTYNSNGIIIVKENGEQLAFHIIDILSLENYLFNNIKFDIPSTTRHRYGKLIKENNGKIYFKLNLQLRF